MRAATRCAADGSVSTSFSLGPNAAASMSRARGPYARRNSRFFAFMDSSFAAPLRPHNRLPKNEICEPTAASSSVTGIAACGELTIERNTVRKSSALHAASFHAVRRRPLEMSVMAVCTMALHPADMQNAAQRNCRAAVCGARTHRAPSCQTQRPWWRTAVANQGCHRTPRTRAPTPRLRHAGACEMARCARRNTCVPPRGSGCPPRKCRGTGL